MRLDYFGAGIIDKRLFDEVERAGSEDRVRFFLIAFHCVCFCSPLLLFL